MRRREADREEIGIIERDSISSRSNYLAQLLSVVILRRRKAYFECTRKSSRPPDSNLEVAMYICVEGVSWLDLECKVLFPSVES